MLPLSFWALGAGAMRLRRQAPWPAAASRSRRVMMPRTWLCSSTTHRWRSPSDTKAVCAKKADVSCLHRTPKKPELACRMLKFLRLTQTREFSGYSPHTECL